MTIREEVGRFIAAEILRDPTRVLRSDEPLISVGLIDSFSLVRLSVFLEEMFQVRVEDTELNARRMDTLDQIVAIVEIHRGQP